ncbi:MAG: hypothetical protein SO440_12395 [Prevotella sp.]|nr:hypothetical protein [Prevotella sp.]
MPECIKETVDSSNAKVYEIDEEKVGQNLSRLVKERSLEKEKPMFRINDPLDDFNDLANMPKLHIPPMYHGTDARIIRMGSEEIKRIKSKCEDALHYMWTLFKPLYDKDQKTLMRCLDFANNQNEYYKLMDKLHCCSAMHNGMENYQYEALYLTNSIERAKGYARRAYAFGEIGEVTYVMYKAAMKIKFNEWNPTEEITETLEFIKEFAEDDSEPVVLKLENLDPLYFEMDNGGLVCQDMLEFEPGEMFSFRYLKATELDLNNKIGIVV